MRVVVVAPPEPVVTWEDADKHLKLDGDDTQKDYVEDLIATATGLIDGPDGWYGRAIGVQTLELYRPAPAIISRVHLPYPPVVDLLAVEALQSNGWVAVDPSSYRLEGSKVAFSAGLSWAIGSREGVRLRYRAGYSSVPAPIRTAILMMVSELYRNRGGGAADFSSAEMLLESTRVYG